MIILSSIFFAINSISLTGTLFSKDGIYENISIIEKDHSGKRARFLLQDRSSSGAKFIDSNELVFDYTKYYKLYEDFDVVVKNALFIGGGSYVMPYALHDEISDANIDVVEIEPQLYEIAKKYFNLKDSNRLRNYVTDGRRFLHDSENGYDYIFSDVYYSLYSIPTHFTTVEFYQLAYDKLNKNGIFIANILGSLHRQKPSLYISQVNSFQKAFANSYIFATKNQWTLDTQNILFVGIKNDKKYTFEDDPNTSLDLNKHLINLQRFSTNTHPYFTDNFAPIDYYTASILHKADNKYSNYLDGEEMLSIIAQKLSYGASYMGSKDKSDVEKFLSSELEILTDEIMLQEWEHVSKDGSKFILKNIIGRTDLENENRILIASHYDAKKLINSTPNGVDYVPGANDSSSGVAVILETARYLRSVESKLSFGIDYIFFDGEEGEHDLNITDWEPLGSNYFSENIHSIYPNHLPKLAIILDMVCDKNLNIYMERASYNNATDQYKTFFKLAKEHYPKAFHNEIKYDIRDDHTPLNEIGIPSILIIDFDYPYFHTIKDTTNKCSNKSLEAVAKTLVKYIETLND